MIFCLSFKGLKIMIILAFLLFLFCVIMLLISIIKPKWGTLEKDQSWAMAELFGVSKSTISRHLKNIFDEGELSKEATVANFATVQMEEM